MDECLDEPALSAVLDGRLNPDDRDAALAHLEECAGCRDRIARGYGADSSVHNEPRPMASGIQIGSRYTLSDPIGEGEWGEVWSAFDERLRRNVAIKILRSERVINPDDHFRTMREAETLARLRHSAIVTVHDSGNFDGRPFLVMDLIKGVPLPVHLEQSKPSADAILALFRHAGAGLAAAHRAAIVHRDFKPANLLIDRAGRLHITDFGLATRIGAATEPLPTREIESGVPESMLELRLTPTLGCLGTPAYLAPELLRGEMATPMSDQFAFCVSLVETLTASRFMTALDVRCGGIERGELKARLLRVHPRLRPVFIRGLDPDASRRYPDLHALLEDVRIRGRRRLVRRVIAAGAGLAGLVTVASLAIVEGRIAGCIPETTPFTRSSRTAPVVMPVAGQHSGMASLRAALQEYQDQRLEAYAEVCRSTNGRPLEASAVSRARFFCLEDARVTEEVLAELVANRNDARPGLHLLERLEDPAECSGLSEGRISAYARSAEAGTQQRFEHMRLVAREHVGDTREGLVALLGSVDPSSPIEADVLLALGVQAANRGSNSEDAMEYFERALASGTASSNRDATFVALLSLLQFDDVDRPRADLLLRLAEPLAQTLGRTEHFLAHRAAHHVRRGDFEQAQADIDLALADRGSRTLIDTLRSRRLQLRALRTRAKIQMYTGEHAAAYDSARAAAQEDLSLSGADASYAVSLAQLGGFAERAKRFEESLAVFEEAAQLFAKHDKSALELRCRVQQSRQLSSLMRWDEALVMLEAAESKAESRRLHGSLAEATTFRAYIHEVRGEPGRRAAACESNRQASLAEHGPTHVNTLQGAVFCADGRAATPGEREALQGVVRTLQRGHEALSQRAKGTSRSALVRGHCELARAALRAGDLVEARGHAEAALQRASEIADNASRTAQILLAEALLRQGAREEGLTHLEAAVEGARADHADGSDNAVDLAGHLAAASRVLGLVAERRGDARALASEARQHFAAANLPLRVAELRSAELPSP